MDAYRTFPAETICHILKYSSPRDVVRWRAVSKWFRAITYDDSLWRDLYAKSRLPRPPGPFPFQSIAYLEQALVRTETLEQSWTTQPMRVVSRQELRTGQGVSGKLHGGRWLVGCERRRRLVLYDAHPFDGTPAPQKYFIWEQEKAAGIEDWDTVSVTMEDGQFVLYVLFTEKDVQLGIAVWKLLEFRLNSESGKPRSTAIFDIPGSSVSGFRVALQSDKSPFLYIWGRNLVFDTRTHIFHEFSESRIALDETRHEIDGDFTIAPIFITLTRTHVIVFHKCSRSVTLIQAFTVNAYVSDGKCFLRLSHEGVLNHPHQRVILLRNSIIDPITGSTNIRLLHMETNRSFLVPSDLTLPGPTGDNVLPITIVTDETIAQRLQEYELSGSHYYADCSDAGYLIGFFIKFHGTACFSQGDLDAFSVMKFAVDATRDKCTLGFGELLRSEGNHIDSPAYRMRMWFDSARGRLCYIKSFEGDEQVVVIADIE